MGLNQFILAIHLIAKILFDVQDPFGHVMSTKLVASAHIDCDNLPSTSAKPVGASEGSLSPQGRLPKLDRITPILLSNKAINVYLSYLG